MVVGKARPDVGTILVNDFGDSYHRTNVDPTTELEKEARKIRHKYRCFEEYKFALATYYEYMDTLQEKYGGRKKFKLNLQSGMVQEFLPPYPRLKKSTTNNYIMNNNIVVSDPTVVRIDEEALNELETELEDEEDDVYVSDKILPSKKDPDHKVVEEIVDKGLYSVKRLKDASAYDILAQYFSGMDNKKNKKGKIKDDYVPSLTDIIEDRDEIEEEDDFRVFRNGRLCSKEEIKNLNFYDELKSLGWNSMSVMKQTVGQLDETSALACALRREKLNKKKEKKRKKKQSKAADEFLAKVMGDNGYDEFEDFQNDMLNMSLNNIFKS